MKQKKFLLHKRRQVLKSQTGTQLAGFVLFFPFSMTKNAAVQRWREVVAVDPANQLKPFPELLKVFVLFCLVFQKVCHAPFCAAIQEAASNLSWRGWRGDTGRRKVAGKMQRFVAAVAVAVGSSQRRLNGRPQPHR